jgi:hypothetical protein
MKLIHLVIAIVFGGLLVASLAGCGGSSGSGGSNNILPPPQAGKANLSFSFKWPVKKNLGKREIPTSSMSISVEITSTTNSDDYVAFVNYPSQTLDMLNVDTGTYTVTATSWDLPGGIDGGGNALSQASTTTTLAVGDNTVNLVMQGIVVTVQITHVAAYSMANENGASPRFLYVFSEDYDGDWLTSIPYTNYTWVCYQHGTSIVDPTIYFTYVGLSTATATYGQTEWTIHSTVPVTANKYVDLVVTESSSSTQTQAYNVEIMP